MRKIRSIWSFILRRMGGNTSGLTNLPASPSGTWYSTLDLPLDKFKRCLVDSDLSALVITGKPSENQLYNAWEALYEQFLDAMKDKDGLYKVRLLGKINFLDYRYQNIQLCLAFLRKAHHPFVETTLRNMVRLDILDPSDKRMYLLHLQTAQNRAQHFLIELESLQAEYAILKKKGEGGRPVTYEDFRKLEAQVSYFMKFRINARDITTGEFASYYSMMREQNDLIRSSNKRRA